VDHELDARVGGHGMGQQAFAYVTLWCVTDPHVIPTRVGEVDQGALAFACSGCGCTVAETKCPMLRTRTGRLVLVGLYSSLTEGYLVTYLEYDRRERKSIRSISSEYEVRGLHYFRLSMSNMTLLMLIC
jgi:hypothetical protein